MDISPKNELSNLAGRTEGLKMIYRESKEDIPRQF